MAKNPLFDIFRVKELRKRVLFTIGMLVVFRLGATLPIPGIDVNALQQYFEAQTGTSALGITEYIDFFAGGAFKNFSVFMLGIMPYISMSIIMQLLLLIFPQLKKISEEEGGRKKIQRYTRYGTVVVCLIQSYTVTLYAREIPNAIVMSSHLAYTLIAMMTVTTGTMFLMWIGEQITEKGIGNGISLIIFAGIVARMPSAFATLIRQVKNNQLNPVFVLVVLAMFVVVVALVIYEQQGKRVISVVYANRQRGRKLYRGGEYPLPLKLNPSGVIPVIFASSILAFPIQIAHSLAGDVAWLRKLADWLQPQGAPYLIIYTLLIIFFAYFYTQVTMNPEEIAKQIRSNGGSIKGIRSENIEAYLKKKLDRIILPGAIFLAFIAVIPSIVQKLFGFPLEVAMLLGGTSLLIMVGVDLDTMSQIEGHLRMHNHDGIVKKGKLKSRNL